MKNIIRISLIIFVFAIFLTRCSKNSNDTIPNNNPNPPAPSGNNISIYGMSYSPSTKTVTKGTIVKWTNDDTGAHTVTSDDGSTFDSGNIPAGKNYSYTTDTAGTFPYHCKIHGMSMAGTLIVQ